MTVESRWRKCNQILWGVWQLFLLCPPHLSLNSNIWGVAHSSKHVSYFLSWGGNKIKKKSMEGDGSELRILCPRLTSSPQNTALLSLRAWQLALSRCWILQPIFVLGVFPTGADLTSEERHEKILRLCWFTTSQIVKSSSFYKSTNSAHSCSAYSRGCVALKWIFSHLHSIALHWRLNLRTFKLCVYVCVSVGPGCSWAEWLW